MLNHLVPERSVFITPPVIAENHVAVAKAIVFNCKSERPVIAAAVCLPSFESEWGLQICSAQDTDSFAVITTTETSMWPSMKAEEASINIQERKIDNDIAEGCKQVWEKMLCDVRHPDQLYLGCDGVNYHFYCFDERRGFLSGTCWSPELKTAPGKLVTIAHALHEFVLDESGADKSLEEVLSAIHWFRAKGIIE